MPPPEVEILLATFNGERFLREQLDSILAQTYPALRITASDDHSTDRTRTILAEYAQRHSDRFRILPNPTRQGSAKANFLHLMQHATDSYLAFADQDDLWLPDKLARSMQKMAALEAQHGPAKPLLVFTDLRVVDASLNPIAPSMWAHLKIRPQSVYSLARMAGQTVVTGCTMLINRPMLNLAEKMPPEAAMHDRWIALLAATLGAADYLTQPAVLYRQHQSNVIGAQAPDTTLTGLQTRAADSTGRRTERRTTERQVEALLRQHEREMPPATAQTLHAYLQSGRDPSALTRVLLTLRHGFFRANLPQNLALLKDLAAKASTTP